MEEAMRRYNPEEQLYWPGDMVEFREVGNNEVWVRHFIYKVDIDTKGKKDYYEIRYHCYFLEKKEQGWTLKNRLSGFSNNDLEGYDQIRLIQRNPYIKDLEGFLMAAQAMKELYPNEDLSSEIPELPQVGRCRYPILYLTLDGKYKYKIEKSNITEMYISLGDDWTEKTLVSRSDYVIIIHFYSRKEIILQQVGDFTNKEKVCEFCKKCGVKECRDCQINLTWPGWEGGWTLRLA